MKKHYDIERLGQIDFFDNFRIDYQNQPVLVDDTDGVYNGNLFEFKTDITDLNKTLFQAIKYLSRMRVKGESVPANILLVSLNTTTLYLYHSQDYFDEIHKIYVGAASKDNEGFIAKPYVAKYDYMDMVGSVEVLKLLKSTNYMPIKLDEDCIVGWAERYYRELSTANKGDFLGDDSGQVKVIGEIREPKHFKGLILPYEGKTNEKFKYLMDKLNDRLKKKDLGAFYTPIPYAEKAAELVRMAIDRVPKGNDYIILDRCAGTGNLESVLTDEELSHCVLSTYEYYEYKVLVERLGDKVRCIIPPTEAQVEYSNGCVLNADAMSKEYIENPILQGYIQDPKCTIILYENPPFSEASGENEQLGGKKNSWKTSYVCLEMKKECKGKVTNDSAHLFIWSGFKYYLRQETDSYILFSPIKYWKQSNIAEKKILKSYCCNRGHFHAQKSAILLNLFANILDKSESFSTEVIDITENNEVVTVVSDWKIRKAFTPLSTLFANHSYKELGIACELDGTESFKGDKQVRVKKYYSDDIICYLTANKFGFEKPRLNSGITRMGRYDANGHFINKDEYIKMLPLFVAAKYPVEDNWWENAVLCKTADRKIDYQEDKDFLKYCLIFTCLSYYNKCLSFKGSDGRDYQNELCFDNDALALKDLQGMQLNDDEKELVDLWNKILSEAKQTKGYDSYWRYGVYQITKELNTFTEIGTGKNKKKVYDYPGLNGDLNSLRVKLKDYYKNYITPKMFEYELIK